MSGGIEYPPGSLIDSSRHGNCGSCVFIRDGFGERKASVELNYYRCSLSDFKGSAE